MDTNPLGSALHTAAVNSCRGEEEEGAARDERAEYEACRCVMLGAAEKSAARLAAPRPVSCMFPPSSRRSTVRSTGAIAQSPPPTVHIHATRTLARDCLVIEYPVHKVLDRP